MNKTEVHVPWFEYLYFFMIVIYAGMAVGYTKQMVFFDKNYAIGFIIPILMTIVLLIRNPVSFFDISFISVYIVITIWLLLQFIKSSYFNFSMTFFIYYGIFISYVVLKVFHFKMFFLYEKIVTQLSIIALVGWVLMIVTPNLLASLIDIIKIPQSESSILRGNIIVYSMTNFTAYNNEFYGLTRNSGFSWEPGRYASMVVIALFFNMARTQFQFKRNISFWILLIALLTTQSTTGYVSFSILLLFLLVNKSSMSKMVYLLFMIPLFITAYNLPFVGEKINLLLGDKPLMTKALNDLKWHEEGTAYVPQRFDGLALEFLNISKDPILGYGIEDDNSYISKNISQDINLANGILKIFARFGLILGALFYFLLYKSSKYIISLYKLKGVMIYMLLYMFISISYDFILVPFFLSTVLFYTFSNEKLKSVRKRAYSKDRVIFDFG